MRGIKSQRASNTNTPPVFPRLVHAEGHHWTPRQVSNKLSCCTRVASSARVIFSLHFAANGELAFASSATTGNILSPNICSHAFEHGAASLHSALGVVREPAACSCFAFLGADVREDNGSTGCLLITLRRIRCTEYDKQRQSVILEGPRCFRRIRVRMRGLLLHQQHRPGVSLARPHVRAREQISPASAMRHTQPNSPGW